MTSLLGLRFKALLGAAILLVAVPAAMAAEVTLDFEDPSWGNPDSYCINKQAPPLFNRPEYGGQTGGYIVDPAGCDEGVLYGSFGSDSTLTAGINATNSNLLRFSWEDPTDNRSWLRNLSFTSTGQPVLKGSPTVHLGIGSSIEMKVAAYAFDATEVESPSGALEFSLIIRETGLNLPLGFNGGIAGAVEFVGCDSKGYGADPDPVDLNTPIGGATVAHSSTLTWTTLKWTFVDDGLGGVGVEVSVDGGTPVAKSIVNFAGDGILSADYNRGTIDGLAIRKAEADTTSKKWFVWIDDIVISAPGVTDPVYIQQPVKDYDPEVLVKNIDPAATAIMLYEDSGSGWVLVGTINSTDPGVDFSDGEEPFVGVTLTEGHYLSATQMVDSLESDKSWPVIVTTFGDIETFTVFPQHLQGPQPNPAYATWYDVSSITWAYTHVDTLDSEAAMGISDGGWSNGVYAVFANQIPVESSFHVRAKMGIFEGNYTDGIDAYQLGVTVNGQHWTTARQILDPCESYGNYKGTLTSGDDSANPVETVYSGEFLAAPGDDLLIAFSTDVIGGGWNLNSQNWNAGSLNEPFPNNTRMIVDNIQLVEGPPPLSACEDVPPVYVAGPLIHDDTTVTVTGVGPGASAVRVYVNDSLAGELDTSTQAGGTKIVDLVSPTTVYLGDMVHATQVYPDGLGGEIEGCNITDAQVGSGPDRTGVMVCVGVRETYTTAAIGSDGGYAVPTGVPAGSGIEFIGATGVDGGPTSDRLIAADGLWHTVSFDPLTDPILSYEAGNGVLQYNAIFKRGALEHVAITPDRTKTPDPGPWVVYIDNVRSGTTLISSFEEFATDTEQVMFRNPRYLTSFGNQMLAEPNISIVDDTQAQAGSKSVRVAWQFVDDAKRWARLTTYSLYGVPSPLLPNPCVSLIQPISFNIRLEETGPAPTFDLVASVVGGNGSVSPTSGTYDLDTVVDLLADPDDGYRVKAWTGTDNDALTTNENTVTMNHNADVTVEFEVIPAQYTLSVTVVGLGTCDPMGGTYEDGTVVNLTAARTGDPASTIAWSGTDNDASTELTNTVTMTGNKSVTVTFTEPSTCNDPAQDTDGDNDVDLTDFGVFSQCFNGPNRAYAVSSPPELVAKCECIDQDGDSDVDLTDFGIFSSCFNGPNRAPGAGCP